MKIRVYSKYERAVNTVKKLKKHYKWHKWFAWRPIIIYDKKKEKLQFIWLVNVKRKLDPCYSDEEYLHDDIYESYKNHLKILKTFIFTIISIHIGIHKKDLYEWEYKVRR